MDPLQEVYGRTQTVYLTKYHRLYGITTGQLIASSIDGRAAIWTEKGSIIAAPGEWHRTYESAQWESQRPAHIKQFSV